MKLPPPLRIVVSALVVSVATALVWWLVGYQIGKGMLSGADAASFHRTFGFDDGSVLRLVFFALASALVVAAGGGDKWPALLGVAFGAVFLFPDHGAGVTVGMILFVLSAAGLSEMDAGAKHHVVAGVAALAVSIAFMVEAPYGRSEIAVLSLLRAVFFFLPLLAVPEYAEKHVLKRLSV